MTNAFPLQEKERRGDYLGKTVQVVPHITDAIQEWIERVAKIPVDNSGEEPDVCIGMFSNESWRKNGNRLTSCPSRVGTFSYNIRKDTS